MILLMFFLGSAQDGGWRSPNDGSSAAYFGKDLLLSRTVYNWFEFVSNGSNAQYDHDVWLLLSSSLYVIATGSPWLMISLQVEQTSPDLLL